jgi:hypothetical protein
MKIPNYSLYVQSTETIPLFFLSLQYLNPSVSFERGLCKSNPRLLHYVSSRCTFFFLFLSSSFHERFVSKEKLYAF